MPRRIAERRRAAAPKSYEAEHLKPKHLPCVEDACVQVVGVTLVRDQRRGALGLSAASEVDADRGAAERGRELR